MAILLGVAEVVLQQAQSPLLVGGGDVVVAMGRDTPAPLLLAARCRPRRCGTACAWPRPPTPPTCISRYAGARARVDGRGGIPSLERALGDPETAERRGLDRHQRGPGVDQAVARCRLAPGGPLSSDSGRARLAGVLGRWLYFNGRSDDARFYLTFLVGPEVRPGVRAAGVRLQLERGGRMESFSGSEELPDAALNQARIWPLPKLGHARRPDLSHPPRPGRARRHAVDRRSDRPGATPGRMAPPIEILGARGWRSGYVVPVMSGEMAGTRAAVAATRSC